MTKKHLHMLHSSVAALAVAMTAGNAHAAMSVSKPGMAPLDANAARTATANFLSPLKAAARAASRDLWGYMYYANAWPTASQEYGFMAFDAATASNFRDLRTEEERNMLPNGGSSLYNGKYNLINYKKNGNSLRITHYCLNTESKWHSEFAPEEVTSMSLLATETATSQLTGKVYGQFYTSDMSSFEFGVIDYDKMERTAIAPSTHKYVAMGVSSEERVYAVATDGFFYEIDTKTGEETKIGPTGVYVAPSSEKSFGQSGEIDQDDDTFYWASFDANKHGALYTVDLKTGLATLVADFPHNELFYGLAVPEATPDAAAPAAPTISVSFNGASTTGQISIVAPSKTYGGSALTGNVDYVVHAGTQQVLNGTMKAGSTSSYNITVPEGMNYITVTLSNAAGKSKKASTSVFVGYDQPKQVSFARLKIDESTGKSTVTWGVPSGTLNGGYLGALKYDVVRYPDGKTVASGTSATTFSETFTDRQLRNYYYGITPVNGTKRGEERRTAAVRFGDNIEPPYHESFDTENDFDLYTVLDANSDKYTWSWHEKNMCAQYESTDAKKTADDWLFTPPVQLRANHSYTVRFKARNSMSLYAEYVEAKWGNAATVAGMTNVVAPETKLTDSNNAKTLEATFNVSKDQIFYLGIHAISKAGTGKIFVDDIEILDNGVLNGPAAVEDFTVTPDPNAALRATVSFRLPEKNVAGNTVGAITKTIVTRDGQTVKEFGAGKAGQTLTCEDASPVAGFNNYTVTAYTSAGAGTPKIVSQYVGLDVPSVPTGLKVNDKQSSVNLTWDKASARGTNGGAVITDDVTFNVYRARSNGGVTNLQLLHSPKDNTYSDNISTTEGAQQLRLYAVSAKNDKGESTPLLSPAVITGAAYQLPFRSGFTTEAGAPLWWSLTADEENGIGFLQNTQTSSDGDNNCLTFTSYKNGGTADISSGKIALGGVAKPIVTFNHSGTADKDIVLDVYASTPDGTQTLLGTVDYNNVSGKADDWHRTSFSIPAAMASEPYVIITFKVTASLYGILKLDDVCVRNTYTNDLSVALSAPSEIHRGVKTPVSVTVTNSGEKAASGYTVTLTSGNKELFSQKVSEALQPLAEKTFKADIVSPVTSSLEKMTLKATVTYDADEYKADNTAYADTKVVDSDVPMPASFSSSKDEAANKLTMTWSTPKAVNKRVTEDFEQYDSWTINQFGDWTTYTGKKGNTTGGWWASFGMPFPHEGENYTYIVFNPEAIQPGITSQNSSIAPRSGEKCLMSMYSSDGRTYYDTDDWLISPMLSGEAQTILFWANNGQPYMTNIRYPQTIEVLYSDKTADHADFQKLSTFTQSGGKWNSYTAELPDGANYFAIRCTTKEADAFCMLFDDVYYYAGYGKLKGYNVYRNDELVATLPADATSTTVTFDPNAEATRYSVSAVYAGGESTAAYDDACQTDIHNVTIDAQHPADVYTVDGRLVRKNATSLAQLPKGIYVVNGKKIVKK